MNNEERVAEFVHYWWLAGRWQDHGRWVKAKYGALEYHPTQDEIAAKCRLLRMRAGRQGPHARSPRGGEFAVATMAGIR